MITLPKAPSTINRLLLSLLFLIFSSIVGLVVNSEVGYAAPVCNLQSLAGSGTGACPPNINGISYDSDKCYKVLMGASTNVSEESCDEHPYSDGVGYVVCANNSNQRYSIDQSSAEEACSSFGGVGRTASSNDGDFFGDCRIDRSAGEQLNSQNCGIVRYVVVFTQALSALVGIVVVIMIVWGGIKYTSAKDNPQQAAEAKEIIRNAIIALVAYFLIFAVLQWLVPGGVIGGSG